MATPVTTPPATEPAAADAVRTEIDGVVGRVVLTAARRRNPLSVATMRAVTAGLSDGAAREGVRVVVGAAEGPAFSAGHDLSEMVDRTLAEEREVFAVCNAMMRAVPAGPQTEPPALHRRAVA